MSPQIPETDFWRKKPLIALRQKRKPWLFRCKGAKPRGEPRREGNRKEYFGKIM